MKVCPLNEGPQEGGMGEAASLKKRDIKQAQDLQGSLDPASQLCAGEQKNIDILSICEMLTKCSVVKRAFGGESLKMFLGLWDQQKS